MKPGDEVWVPGIPGTISALKRSGTLTLVREDLGLAKVLIRHGRGKGTVTVPIKDLKPIHEEKKDG